MQVHVVVRVAALLRLLAANNRTGLRLVDVVRMSELERSTVHRLLQSLVAEGLVYQDQESKRYFLGMAIYEMGVAVPALHLRDVCQPYVMKIARETGDTVFLTVRSGFNGICVDRKEGGMPVAYVQEAGRSRPLTVGAGGLAILSALDESEMARICAENLPRIRESYPNYSKAEIDSRLTAGRSLGYVLADVLEKPGVKALGMCIRDGKKRPIAAISLSALASKWTGRRVEIVLDLLRESISSLEASVDFIKATSKMGPASLRMH